MSKLVSRLLLFALGVPAILAIIVFLPQAQHLAVNVLVVVVSALGAVEFALMLRKKGYPVSIALTATLGSLLPVAATLAVSFGVPRPIEIYAFLAGGISVIGGMVFGRKADLDKALERVLAGLAVLIYPGFFMSWVIHINAFQHATALVLIYAVMVFGNDSLAWAVGMLFGEGNRGIVPASPNKSVVGFAGGIFASVLVGAAAALLFPSVFPGGGWAVLKGAAMGFFVGAAAIVGDLAESTLKRSAGVKDSGNLMPGRGGVLDSIDSLAFAAPVYLASYLVFFG